MFRQTCPSGLRNSGSRTFGLYRAPNDRCGRREFQAHEVGGLGRGASSCLSAVDWSGICFPKVLPAEREGLAYPDAVELLCILHAVPNPSLHRCLP